MTMPFKNPSSTHDAYGGIATARLEATGWFRIHRVGSRCRLVTPEGGPFVALGINHIAAVTRPGEGGPDLFAEKYGRDIARLREDVMFHLREWGCNTVDGWANAQLGLGMPFVAAATIAPTAKHQELPNGRFPDVFDPAVRQELIGRIENLCAAHRDNRYLIGYCWTDTPTWDLAKTRKQRGTDWVSSIRSLGRGAPGKQAYIQFLRMRYQDRIEAVRETYGIQAASFDSLQGEAFSALDLSRPGVLADDEEFLGQIALEYYGAIGPVHRKCDPHHLVFGENFLLSDHPDAILKAAACHLDAISIQPGDGYTDLHLPSDKFFAEEFDWVHRLTGKPIWICDHQISFPIREYSVTTWTQRRDEQDAAEATVQFLRDAFTKPYVLGYMRCQYIDRYEPRRKAVKQGLLHQDGTPHPIMADAYASAYREILYRFAEFL